jgi:hypothetical protein
MQKTAPRDFKVYKEADYPQDKKASSYPDWPPQAFHVSHLGEGSFKTDGFRPWALSRDMGMIEATGGMVDVHVNRRAKPRRNCAPPLSQYPLPNGLCAQGLGAQ